MPTAKRAKSPSRGRRVTLEWWNYDVWGNARDGYDVNDRSSSGTMVELRDGDGRKDLIAVNNHKSRIEIYYQKPDAKPGDV